MAQKKALISILQNKLSQVTSQNEKLHNLYANLDGYVNKLTDSAQAAIKADNQELTPITEMSCKVEMVLAFLMALHSEIEDFTADSPAEILETDVPGSTLSLSLSKLSSAVKPQSAHGCAPNDISKLHQRIDLIEMAVTGCRSEISQSTAQQNDKAEQLEAQCCSFQERLKSLENSDVMTQRESVVKNHEKRLEKLEAGAKQEVSRLDYLGVEVDTMKNEGRMQQNFTRLVRMEKDVETLYTHCTSLEDQVKAVQETSRELTSKVNMLADKSDLIDVLKTNRTMKKTLEELSSRVDATESSLKTAASYREKEENKRRELEDRILVAEENRRKDLGHYLKRQEEVDSLYKQVCHIVDSRVTPLRRLLHILNNQHKTVEKRQEMAERLDKVTDQVNDISSKVANLEISRQPTVAGFTAKISRWNRTQVFFRTVEFNEGNCYDPVTSEFTAPQDGLYLTNLTMGQGMKEGEGEVNVMHYTTGNEEYVVCTSKTSKLDMTHSGIGLVKMRTGDKLYVKKVSLPSLMSDHSRFSCVLIK